MTPKKKKEEEKKKKTTVRKTAEKPAKKSKELKEKKTQTKIKSKTKKIKTIGSKPAKKTAAAIKSVAMPVEVQKEITPPEKPTVKKRAAAKKKESPALAEIPPKSAEIQAKPKEVKKEVAKIPKIEVEEKKPKEPGVPSPIKKEETTTIEKPPEVPVKIQPKGVIQINEFTTTKDFASKLGVSAVDVVKKAMGFGQILTLNQKIDKTLAELIANDYNFESKFTAVASEPTEQKITGTTPRAPIVTVMGHVDHGKTTLLDSIRESDIISTEHGAITQHIGAYRVKTTRGDVVFLDTPGHEAFTALRARGSKVTDIVILVVSAADGVMPQTVEAINHAKAAKVPIIVAINKIDIPGANPEKVKSELNQHGLSPEEWGGDTLMVEISARNNININKLLEAVHLQADMLELKCSPNAPAEGTVIESKLDHKKGAYITVMVRNGTLKIADAFVAGESYGKVRAMFDEFGQKQNEAKPSTPIAIMGANSLPSPGDRFYIVESEKDAREITDKLKLSIKEFARKPLKVLGLGDFDRRDEKILKIILKADVLGSLEAISEYIEKIEHPEFKIHIIHAGVGTITESDINLARTTGSAIIGFNVKSDSHLQSIAERHGIEIRLYRVIYELFDDIKKALEGLLEPKLQEAVTGKAEVRKIMKITKVGIVAGSYVVEGKMTRNTKCRLIRDGAIIYDGRISSLRRFKEDVQSVEKGFECGITFENFQDIKENDIIETYTVEKVKRFL